MALTAAQKAQKDSLNRTAGIFALVGVGALATFGATLGASLFAGLMFTVSLTNLIKAASIGAPAPAAGPAPAPAQPSSFWSGFALGHLLKPSPKVKKVAGSTVVVPAQPHGVQKKRGRDLAGGVKVYPKRAPAAAKPLGGSVFETFKRGANNDSGKAPAARRASGSSAARSTTATKLRRR